MAIVRLDPYNGGGCRMQVWKAQIAIVGDSWLGYRSIDRSMTCSTCEQRLRQSAAHVYCDASVNLGLYLSQPAACTTTTNITEQYAVLNLKQNLRSTYCSEANDRHEASRGLDCDSRASCYNSFTDPCTQQEICNKAIHQRSHQTANML